MTTEKLTSQDSDNQSWLDNDRGLRRLGYFFVAFTVIVIGGWATIAPIESAAIAPGIVQVQGKRKPVQHLEGGIIAQIHISNGDKVIQGQPLLQLDATRHRADREILLGRVFATTAAVSRLRAERDGQQVVYFPEELTSAALSDARAKDAMISEVTLFNARSADLEGEANVIHSQRRGLEAVASAKRVVDQSLDQEIQDLKELLEDGYVDKTRLRELERLRSKIIGELADLEVSIDETELKVIQLRKRFKTQVVDELTEVQERLNGLREEYSAADDKVYRASIRAPVAGTVLNLSVNTIGAVIGSGETLLELVPNAESLMVETRISPMDIDRVMIGQEAEVRFAVFKDAYLISGVLEKISADRLVDKDSDVPYYRGEITLDKSDLFLLEGMELIPGMPAEALIKTGNRTMMGYITSPLNRMFSRSLIED